MVKGGIEIEMDVNLKKHKFVHSCVIQTKSNKFKQSLTKSNKVDKSLKSIKVP